MPAKHQSISKIEQHVIDVVFKLRRANKITQRDLATILGVKASFVGNVESEHNIAKYNLKHINLIAHYFSVSPKDFFPDVAITIP